VRRKIWRVLTAISALPDGNTFVQAPKNEPLARMSEYKNQKYQKGMTPMKTLVKFSDAPCHPVLARRSTWPRGFRNTSREQLAEIGRAFARGDKRTVDQAYAELKATSLQHGRRHPQLGMLTMSNSTLSGNSAYSGGAIHNWSGATLTIANSTLAATFAAPRSTPTAAASSMRAER
jgi:hypothetical protein